MEKSRNLLFSRKELLARSQDDFRDLSTRKVLTYRRPPESVLEQILHLRCSYGCPLTVVELSDESASIILTRSRFPSPKMTSIDINSTWRGFLIKSVKRTGCMVRPMESMETTTT